MSTCDYNAIRGHFGLSAVFCCVCCCCSLLGLLLVMSVDPLRTLVRRLRAAANSDDAQLSAALAAIPSAETLRLYYFCRDHVQQAHLDYETEGSSEYDLPPFPPEGSSRAAAQVTNIDLLDLQPDLLDARGSLWPLLLAWLLLLSLWLFWTCCWRCSCWPSCG